MNFTRLKSYFGDDKMHKTFSAEKRVIMNALNFFKMIWESLIDADKLYDKLANYNEELDALLSSDLNDGIVDHWRYIESLVKQKFDDLVSKLNNQFYTNRTCFTISDETCIARILHPIRQEFGKFQNKMQQVMTQIQSTTQ